jgi:hypothetical protein
METAGRTVEALGLRNDQLQCPSVEFLQHLPSKLPAQRPVLPADSLQEASITTASVQPLLALVSCTLQ